MRKLKLFLAMLMLMCIGVTQMWGAEETITYVFGDRDWAATVGETEANWTCNTRAAGFTANQGTQITTSADGANATSPESFDNISKIVVNYCTNSKKGAGAIKVKVGEGTEKSYMVTAPSANGTTRRNADDFTFSPAESGKVTLTVNCTANSIYIYSVTITYTPDSGDDPGDDPGTQKTDVTDEQLAWSAASAEVTMGAENTFPTLTNTLPLDVTYQSTNTAVATIDANGDVTLVKAGTTTIKAIFDGDDDYNAKTISYTLTVNPAPLQPIEGAVVDVLTAANFTATQTQYTNFSGKQATNDGHSEAVYAGNTAKNSTNIQMTKKDSNKSPQIASTTSGGNVKRVEVIFGGSNTDGRKIAIYGRNTAYDGSTYSTTTDTKLGEITYSSGDASGYIDVEGNYQYLVIISVDGAMYLSEVRISWLPATKHELIFGVAESGHGTLAASVGGAAISTGAQVAEGATVTLTPTADQYYQVNAVEVLDGNAAEVTTTENAGVYTFAMPASDAVAEVSFAYIPVTSLTLNESALELLEGAEATLSVTAVEPAEAYNGVTWASDDDDVVMVDEEGAVLAIGAGTATITATSKVTGTITATCAVTVTAPSGHEIGITSANGTVEANTGVDVADVLKDVAVVLTATPNDGYTISGWTVVGAEYTVSEDKTTCSFTMPDDAVLVEVTYTHEVAVLKLHDANGESTFAGDHFWMEEVTLPTEAASCSKTFMGWSADPNCATAEGIIEGATYVLPNIGENHIYAVYASVVSTSVTSYVKTALNEIESGSIVIITHDNGDLYAMSNDQGASNAPTAVAVTDEEGVLTEGVADNVLWTITKDGDNLSFAKGTDKLYCTSSNNGVRVGSGAANVFIIKDKYLYNTGNSAYVGVYTSTDWRRYGSINSNISGQTLAFYKKTVSDPVYGNYSTVCQPQAATPTFTVAAGTYYVGQSVELACTTDGATIHYTLDGTEPTTSSATYSAAISLSERAITTIKAIAVAEGYENSAVAEAEYNINLPYDFADFAALTKENGKEYAVRGIISEKGELNTTYNELPYWISANGSTEGQIKCHNGLGLNKAEFTTESADAVNPGDNVTVVGTWSTQYNNIGAANWMLEYTARAHDSYEIVGDLTTTGFQVGEAFDDAILANLSVKEVFTNGYEEAVAGATFNCGDKTEWLENETTLTVYAKLGDDDLTSKNFGVTVSSATLVSFVLKEGYKTEYYVGDAFVKPTVIATLSDNTHPEAEATACTGYNMSEAGNYTVNVSYTYGDITISEGVEYQITVKKVFDNEDDPHTVAIAKELIEPYTTTSTDYMWVRGIVSQVGNLSSGKLKYYISDNGATEGQLYVYDGKYIGGANFTDANKLQVNDEVVIKGKAQNYQGNTLELTSSQVISLARGVEVTVANVAELEVGQADLAVEDLTITTLSEGAVTLVSGDEAIATIVDNKIHAVAAGEVTITANVAANGIYKAASAEFTVNVVATKDRYTVTFSTGEAGENVSGDAPEAIADQLENAPVTLPACTWTWEGHKFTGWAVTYGENVPVDVENNQFNMPAANVTITAQWAEVVTAKISFMVGGEEKASIYKEQEVAFTIEQDGAEWAPAGFTFVGWSTTEQEEETAAAPATITEYTPQAGIPEVSLYGIYSRHDDSDPNYGKYEKATAVVDGDYLIVNENAGKAFDGNLTTLDNNANSIDVEINDGVIGNSTAVDNAIFTIDAAAGTVKSHSGYYIGVEGYSNGLKQSSNAADYINELGISGDNAAIEMTFTGGTMHLLYNTSNRFRYYKAVNQTNKDIQLYKKNTGTMWYTSSPAEKVAITFDANGGQGGCTKAIINKGDQLTICETAPTKSHSEFAGWKNGDDEYVAGTAYAFEADITLTAQWNDAPTFTVTFDMNGGTGTAETMKEQYAGDAITLPAALTKDGFTFQGWKYNDKLYKAGASFILPAANVTFVAQFRKTSVPTNKMSLVTDANALANGMQIALGCNYDNSFSMAGDLGSNKYMASVTESVSLADNIATYPNTVVVLTLEQVEGGWNLTKDGTNYLTISGSDLKWDTKANATAWAISFDAGNVKIAIGDYWIQYNSGSPRFKPYNSNQKQIQLFGQAVVVTEDISISDLGYTEGATIVADGDITLTIDEQTKAQSITAKNGATVEVNQLTTAESVVVEDGSKIVANAKTTTPTVYFSTSMGSTQVPGSASELGSVENITLATGGEIIYDLTLGTSMEGIQADPKQWHAFTLPFAVDALNGIYDAETGAKLQNEVNYAIMDYHGDIRANGDYGWKKYRGILQPGVFYIMTVDGNTKTFRFKAAKTGAMTQTTSMGYKAYNGSGDPSKDFGWNGIGNPSWVSGRVTVNVQVLDPYSYTYQPLTSSTNITVSTPFFYNAGGDGSTGSVVMQDAGAGANYAPARTPANEIKNVAISFGNEVFRDKLYISASEDALNEYEQDKDLVRMIMSNTPKVAQIFGNAYGMKLSMVNAPMSNDKAEYSLTLYAPNAGEYTISAPAMEDADIYLTKDGAIIWNLSMSEYTNDFAKGNNEGYGLLLVKKGPQVVTGVENIEAVEAGVQKVVVDQNVFILRGEKMYDVTGKMVK